METTSDSRTHFQHADQRRFHTSLMKHQSAERMSEITNKYIEVLQQDDTLTGLKERILYQYYALMWHYLASKDIKYPHFAMRCLIKIKLTD